MKRTTATNANITNISINKPIQNPTNLNHPISVAIFHNSLIFNVYSIESVSAKRADAKFNNKKDSIHKIIPAT